jgi:hypothetical protein
MGPDPDSNRISPGRIVIAIVILIVGYLLIVKPLLKGDGSSGGLLGGGGCSTSLEYKVPKSQLNGVGTTMTARRCSGSYDQNGHQRSYVEATIVVNGKTEDGSNVKALKEQMSLQKRSAAGEWQHVPATDIPKDSGVSTDGSSVAYERHVRWQMRHVPARVVIVIKLKTDGSKPAQPAKHIFSIP